jgi:hypothetical protein
MQGPLGDKTGGYVPRPTMYEYKPPSLLAQYKWLALVFAVIVIVFAAYCIKKPRAAPRVPPAPQVYIEPISTAPPRP